MALWVAGTLLVLCIAGIVGVTLHMRKQDKKGLHIVGVVLLTLCSLVLCGYLVLSGILLYNIR